MFDAWQMIGRMACEKDFHDAVMGPAFQARLRELAMPVGEEEWEGYVVDLSSRLDIPGAHFDALRDAVKGKVCGPTSLIGLGEVLAAMRYEGFPSGLKDLSELLPKAAREAGVSLRGRDALFYAAFGALIVDPVMRVSVIKGGDPMAKYGFDGLGAGEAELRRIFGDDKVDIAVRVFCEGPLAPWKDGCLLNLVHWPQYRHPLGTAARRAF